jgi:hypothetical protein
MNVTPWFPPHIKPVRVGEYEIESVYADLGKTSFKAPWDGTFWHSKEGYRLAEQDRRWRGLASDPSQVSVEPTFREQCKQRIRELRLDPAKIRSTEFNEWALANQKAVFGLPTSEIVAMNNEVSAEMTASRLTSDPSL